MLALVIACFALVRLLLDLRPLRFVHWPMIDLLNA
jgi:hypothetical protein